MRISIIVPCYNEQAVLKLFYVEIVKVLEKITNNYELLFVDDGSQDSTLSIIKTLCINNCATCLPLKRRRTALFQSVL